MQSWGGCAAREVGHGGGQYTRGGQAGLALTQVGSVRDDEPLLPVLEACGNRHR